MSWLRLQKVRTIRQIEILLKKLDIGFKFLLKTNKNRNKKSCLNVSVRDYCSNGLTILK